MEVAHDVFRCGRFAVSAWLHTEHDIPAAEWSSIMAQILAFKRAHKIDLTELRMLVLSDGGAPNAAQRAQFRDDFLGGGRCKVSIVTPTLSNPIKRGVAVAVKWSNPGTEFFTPQDIQKALKHLDLAGSAAELRDRFKQLGKALPNNVALTMATPNFV